MSKTPKVSVVSISYNQENYIRQTLESFVAQKTDFDFEVVIADDGSTDKTPIIIEEFSQAYPDIFRPILRKKNIGVQPNLISALQAANGKYIALCEGDDYWTDPLKLQKQTDFLDKNPDHALCFHYVTVFFENNEEKDRTSPLTTEKKTNFTTTELVRRNFIPTNAVMYRKQSYDRLPDNVMPLDWYLHLYHAQFGKIGFIDKTMAACRRHSGGVWWDAYADQDKLWKKHGLSWLGMYIEALKIYGDDAERRRIIYKNISTIFTALMKVDKKYSGKLLKTALLKLPDNKEDLVVSMIDQQQELANDIEKLRAEHEAEKVKHQAETEHYERVIADREYRLENKANEAAEYQGQLNIIINSKSWRYIRKAASLKAAVKSSGKKSKE